MKITIYELLGLVKDGKMPKKVKYNNDVYVYIKKYGDYRCEKTLLYLLDKITRNCDYDMSFVLKSEVEIIEETPIISKLYINNELQYNLEEEKKIPEKLSTWFSVETKQSKELNIEYANTNFENMYEKINEIIDYLKNKGDE